MHLLVSASLPPPSSFTRSGTTPALRVIFRDANGVNATNEPGGKHYYQLMVNPAGGCLGLKWSNPGSRIKWNSDGIETAGHLDFDYWSCEVKIHFAALGVASPRPGESWGANLCRTEVPGKRL